MVSQWDDFIFVGTSKEMSLAGAATKYNCPLWNDFDGIENHLWLHLSKYTYCENCSQRREHYWYYGSSFSHAVTKIIADDKNFSLLLRRRYIDFANPCTLMLIVNNTIYTDYYNINLQFTHKCRHIKLCILNLSIWKEFVSKGTTKISKPGLGFHNEVNSPVKVLLKAGS